MAKRKARVEEEPRELTRKEHRIRARDRERNRRLMIGTGIALGLAALVIIAGLLSEFVFKPNSSVATVGGTEIVTRDFRKRVKWDQNQYRMQLAQYSQLEQQFGGQGFFASQISQLQGTLSSPFSLGSQVLEQMIREEVIRQQAKERGITVSAEEVEAALREQIANSQNMVTVPQATATTEAAAAATATAASWTPTPDPAGVSGTVTATSPVTGSAAVTTAESPTATAAVTAAAQVTAAADITASADVTTSETSTVPTPAPPTPLPIITDAQFQEGLTDLENTLRDVAGMTLDDYRRIVEVRLLNDKLAKVIGEEQVPASEEQVHARHILLSIRTPEPEPTPVPEGQPTPEPTLTPTPVPEGEPTPTPTPGPRDDAATLALAQELRQRLLDGEDFATLAQEYSDDPGSGANGGDLDWFGRGAMVAPFEEAAFSLEPGQVSEPVKSDFGYHLIEVLEKDPNRAKDPSRLEQERQQAYQTWLQEKIAATPIERADLLSRLPPDLPTVVPVAPVAPAEQQVPLAPADQ